MRRILLFCLVFALGACGDSTSPAPSVQQSQTANQGVQPVEVRSLDSSVALAVFFAKSKDPNIMRLRQSDYQPVQLVTSGNNTWLMMKRCQGRGAKDCWKNTESTKENPAVGLLLKDKPADNGSFEYNKRIVVMARVNPEAYLFCSMWWGADNSGLQNLPDNLHQLLRSSLSGVDAQTSSITLGPDNLLCAPHPDPESWLRS